MNQLIVGTMTWGAWGRKFSTQEMAEQIRACEALGLVTFDHADIYGGYTTEAEFGKAFVESGMERTQAIFISKCGIQYPCEERPLAVKHYNYTRQHIVESAENSLRNLKTDYLDALLLHRPSPLLQTEEVMEAFTQLKQMGKVKTLGVSNFTPSQMALLKKECDIEWNQIECSLSHATPMFDGTLDFHQTHSIGTMAWSPLGAYFKSESPRKELLECMEELKSTYQLSEDQLLLAWLMKHPAKIHPVVGTTQIDRLKKAKEALSVDLSLEDWFKLHTAQEGKNVP